MPRRSSNVAVVCCLLIAIATAAVWVRGLVARDQFTTYVAGRKCVAAVFPQHVYVIAYPAPVGSVATRFQAGLNQYPSRPIYWELRYHYRPGGAFRLGIPFWLPLAFAIAPPMWWVVQRVQTRRRRSHGLCRECGYDLRASRDRCPECGTPIPGERTRADGTANTEAISPDSSKRYETTKHWQISLK